MVSFDPLKWVLGPTQLMDYILCPYLGKQWFYPVVVQKMLEVETCLTLPLNGFFSVTFDRDKTKFWLSKLQLRTHRVG